MASPPVVRSGMTVFSTSADPSRLFDRSISLRVLLLVSAAMKPSASKSSTSALLSTSFSKGQSSRPK